MQIGKHESNFCTLGVIPITHCPFCALSQKAMMLIAIRVGLGDDFCLKLRHMAPWTAVRSSTTVWVRPTHKKRWSSTTSWLFDPPRWIKLRVRSLIEGQEPLKGFPYPCRHQRIKKKL